MGAGATDVASNVLAFGFALTAAALFAVGSVMESRAASEVPDDGAGVGGAVGLMARLLRRKLWLGGVVVGGLGFVFHALALGAGAVVLVQVLITSTLLFALPLSARWGGRRLGARDLALAVALTASLAVFVAAGDPSIGQETAPLGQWLPSLALMGATVVVLVGTGSATSGRARAAALGAAAGMLFGVAAPLTKSSVAHLGDGVGVLLGSWESYVLVVVGLGGIVLQQMSFQVGAFEAAFPAATVMEPLVGAVLGVAVLDETIRTSDARVLAVLVAVPVMIVATTLLANSQANAQIAAEEAP